MATTLERPAAMTAHEHAHPADNSLAAVEALFSRMAGPQPPMQFTGVPGARYNMAGGQPDPVSLPRQELAEIAGELLAGEEGPASLMYGDPAGYQGLREALAAKLQRWERLSITPDEIVVVNGSLHGLAIVARAVLNPGEAAIVEAPTFMGALRPLRQLQARVESVPIDAEGLRPDLLEETLQALRSAGTPAKLLYTIPNFHNPAGVTMSLERRRRVAELADEYNFVILEDDAYGELRISGDHVTPILGLASPGRVVRSATLSKILAAGLRVGYLTGAKEVVSRINGMKLDGGAGPFTNRVAARWIAAHHDAHVRRLIDIYRHKRDALLRGLDRGLAGSGGARPTWHVPEGGFFLWVKLPAGIDSERVRQETEQRSVAYVPGPLFFADGTGREYIRLAWSMLSAEDLEQAGALVGESIAAAR